MSSSIFKSPEDLASGQFTEIIFTETARSYLWDLLDAQDDDVMGIRVFINNPGTPKAETCIAYCREGDAEQDMIMRTYAFNPADTDSSSDTEKSFTAYFDPKSWDFLDSAKIDYAEDRMGGQLTIKAPNSKTPQVHTESPLADRINYLLYTEVNPSLAAHGGEVSLVTIDDVDEQRFAVLRFGGGCQGCSAVDMTLKEHLPDLAGVKDVTDHTDRSNAYY